MEPLKIIHIPGHRDYYQKFLLKNLKKLGLDVTYGRKLEFISMLNFSILYNLLTNFDLNIIHIHWQHPFLLSDSKFKSIIKSTLFICQLVIIKIFRKNIVWTIHNLTDHESAFKKIELFFSNILAKYADAIIVHCEHSRSEIISAFKIKDNFKISVIPHGNFSDLNKKIITKNEAKNKLNLNPDDFIFLFFGLIRPYKGVTELIRTFKEIDERNSQLIITGKIRNQDYGNFLRKLAQDKSNIKIKLQFVTEDQIQIYFNAADVVILPYRHILNSGNAILSASFGKPIIAPRLGCIPEIFGNKGGFFYSANDKSGLKKAIENALKSKDRLKELEVHNLNLTRKLNWQRIAYSTNEIYRKLSKMS